MNAMTSMNKLAFKNTNQLLLLSKNVDDKKQQKKRYCRCYSAAGVA